MVNCIQNFASTILPRPCTREQEWQNWARVREFANCTIETVAVTRPLWGKATGDSFTAVPPSIDYVEVNPCDDRLGTNPDTSTTHRVYLPKRAGYASDVSQNDVIAYAQSKDETYVILSDYSVNQHIITGGLRFIEATLTSSLAGGTASANVDNYWGNTGLGGVPVSPVVITDVTGAGQLLRSSDKVVAMYDEEVGRWIMLDGPDSAGYRIDFTLSGALSGGTATAAVTDYSGGPDPGASVTITDSQGLFVDALTGATGSAIWDGTGSTWRPVACQTIAGRINFTLSVALSGGSALATVNSFGGAGQAVQDPGSTVTVYDPGGMYSSALSGAKGVASWNSVAGRYEVDSCQGKAAFIRFTSTENMGATLANQMSVTTDAAFGPAPAVQSPGNVTVLDSAGLFSRALSGAKGLAGYNSVADKYEVIECQSKAGVIWGSLTEDFGETTGGEAAASISGGGFGGSQQDEQDPSAMGVVTVIDSAGTFGTALSGATFVAILDGSDYVMVASRVAAKAIRFTVNDAGGFTTADASFGIDGVVALDGGQTPSVTSCANLPASTANVFKGDDNDKGLAVGSGTAFTAANIECP